MKAVAAVLCLVVPHVSAVGFQVEGTMTIAAKNPAIAPLVCKMRVEYKDCRWAISQVWEKPSYRITRRMTDDLQAIYVVSQIESNSAYGWIEVTNSHVAAVHGPGFPHRMLASEMVILFYAYASSCYLNSSASPYLGNIKFQPSDWEQGDRLARVTIRRNDGPLQLPVEICFLNLAETKTNALLVTSAFTNLGGIHVPAKVLLTRFTDEGEVLGTYAFDATVLRTVSETETFRPTLASGTLVEDHRFSHGKAYVPPIAHGPVNDWPSEDAARAKRGYNVTQLDWERIQASQKSRGKPLSKRSPFVMRAIFCLVAGAPLIFLLMKWQKSPNVRRTRS
jgi:hypothetical protein